MYYALEAFAGKKEETEIRRRAKQEQIVPDYKLALRPWAGPTGSVWNVTNLVHPLDGTITPMNKKLSYAADYHQASTYVHCSLPGTDAYCPEEGVPFRVSPPSAKLVQPSGSTLLIILSYLHNLIAYALFGMNLERPDKLHALFHETFAEMKPIPRRHRR